jgi:UDP-N-acetyl-D-galactosamine dehydrogenase
MKNLFDKLQKRKTKLGVVGLGYVGLPLAHAFASHFDVVGFDVNAAKVELMKQGIDPTGEVPEGGLNDVEIDFTTDPAMLKECRFIVVAVPTPVDGNKRPDLTPLIMSSTTVGKYMPRDSVVVFESTVYPGVTEDECVPLLEKYSGLEYHKDFKVGYSPERINPGDQVHRLQTITKVVSGSDDATLEVVAKVYEAIIEAGVHRASCIKVAEAAKVIENTQRDVNIALMNELSIIFHKLDIDTLEVLRAAGTKWNFLNFFPGLVGGHCIGVDPYYLTYKAEEMGYHPEVILSGRRINDNMGKFVAENTVKKMIKAGKAVKGAKVLLIGPSGVGKSHIAAALGHQLIERGVRVKWFSAGDLVQQLQAAKKELDLMTYMTRLDKYPVLIIDDIGYVKKGDGETQVLFEFIAHRYESGSLIITSNQPFSQWDQIFPDALMTVAAIDRIIHHASIIEIEGGSYRKKQHLRK